MTRLHLPTSFVLPAEAVDRLRTAAGAILMALSEFQRLLKDVGAKVVPESSSLQPATSAVQVAVPTGAVATWRVRRGRPTPFPGSRATELEDA